MTQMSKQIEDTLSRKREWSLKTFGSIQERGPVGPLKHLLLEIEELKSNPEDLTEWVDCFFLIDDAAYRAGYDIWDGITDNMLREFWASDFDSCLDTLRVSAELLAHNPSLDEAFYDGLLVKLLCAFNKTEHPWHQFVEAIEDKFQILLTRTYLKTPDGVPSEHVR